MGCGKSFLYEYGQGEKYWMKCGEELKHPDEVALCQYCKGKKAGERNKEQ